MSLFIKQMNMEKKRLEKQIHTAKQSLALAPEGTLSVRKRKRGTSYYQNTLVLQGSTKGKRQLNITRNRNLIKQLTQKAIQKKLLIRAQFDLYHLEKLLSKYITTSLPDIAATLGDQYQTYLAEQREEYFAKAKLLPYPKAPRNPKAHIHETDCGEFVRSKSEQIILNSLTCYDQFITHYEEEFTYQVPVEGLGKVYPDFTLILPSGKRKIWEHLGLLDDPAYCRHTALKLCLYQRNGYVIGDNLILTMDDHNGNISSALVLEEIQKILSEI